MLTPHDTPGTLRAGASSASDRSGVLLQPLQDGRITPEAETLGRSLLAPGSPTLRTIVERRPWRVWADVAGLYVSFVLAFALLAVHPAWWTAVVAFLVIGNRQYALSVLTHDGDHRTLFHSRRTNDLFSEILLCAPIGVDFVGEQVNHGNHHRLLATVSDPDRYLYSVEDKDTVSRFLLFLTGLTMFPRAIRKALRGSATAEKKPSSRPGFLIRRRYLLLGQALLFGTICLFFPWWYYPVFWLAPVYPLVFVPHKIRMFCEHAQPILPDTAADDRRLVTYVPGRIERLLFSPYNLNYHAEHHLWPFVPYYNLQRLHTTVVASGRVEIRRSYLGFIVSYLRRLPLTMT